MLALLWLMAPSFAASTSYRVIVQDRNSVLTEGTALSASNVDGASQKVTLRDDGQAPDAKAKDGSWTATLTVSAEDAVFLDLTTPSGNVRGSGAVSTERPDLRLILNGGQLVPERGNEVKGAASGPAPGSTPLAVAPTSAPAASAVVAVDAAPAVSAPPVPTPPSVPSRVSSWSDLADGLELWAFFAAGFGVAMGGASAYLMWRRTDIPAGGLRGRWGMRMVDEWRRLPGRPSVLIGPGAADRVFRTPVSPGEVWAVASKLGPRTLVGVTDVDLLDRERPDETGLDALIRRFDGRFEIHVALEVPDVPEDGPADQGESEPPSA